MKTPTVYIATLEDRERMALHPLDDRSALAERFVFPVVWRPTHQRWLGSTKGFGEWPWNTSCLSSTAPSDADARVEYGEYPGGTGQAFDDETDAIAWLLEQEEARRAR